MTAAAGEQPGAHEEFEQSLAIEAISVLDQSRMFYLQACSDYAAKPSRKNFAAITDMAVPTYTRSFGTVVDALLPEVHALDYAKQMALLITTEGSDRVDGLNQILEASSVKEKIENVGFDISGLDSASAEEGIEESLHDKAKASLRPGIMEVFETCTKMHTAQFAEKISRTRVGKMAHVRQEVGKHALDIGKTAVAVFIGVALANRSFRRK